MLSKIGRHGSCRAVIAVLLLVSLAVAPVVAAPPTDTSTATGNSTGNETASGSGGGGLINVNPWEWTKEIVIGAVESFIGGVESLLDKFNGLVFGLPAPGETTNVDTWTDPSNAQWPGVWSTYWIMAGLSLSILPISALVAQGKPERERRQLHRTQARQFVLILAGWIICAFALHTADAISIGLAPSGADLMNTPGSTAKLGLGIVVGVGLLFMKGGVVVLGLLVLVAEYWLAHLLVAFWPLFCAFRGSPIKSLQSFGNVGISMFGTLLLLKIFQSGVLRFLYELEWTLGSGDQLVASVVATSVGLAIALVGAPILFMKKMVPSGMMVLGGSLKQKPEKLTERVRGRATDSAKEYAESARSRVATSDRSPTSDSPNTTSRPNSDSTSGSTDTSPGGFETLADKFSTDNDNE